MESRTDYWRRHYQDQHSKMESVGLARSVEYANERVQLQLYAHILEAVGQAYGKTILDVGCGWGNSTLMLHACGGQVTGTDIVPETIEILRVKYPFISWSVIDVMDERAMRSLPTFDCVVATEVLEHVEFQPAMEALWAHVAPGGRLVATVPNRECPILQNGLERWGIQRYLSHISPAQITGTAQSLGDVTELRVKGFSFKEDQHFLPYEESDWDQVVKGTPNRIIFCLMREA